MKPNELPDHLVSVKRYHIVAASDPAFGIVAGCIFFQNQGTTRVLLDNHIVLDPGETYSDMDLEGGVIQHSYSIKFIDGAPSTAADVPRIYEKERLLIATITRKIYL